MPKPKKHRRHRPYSLNRCWCKMEKIMGKPDKQKRVVIEKERYGRGEIDA